MPARNFQDLHVWQIAMELCEVTYALTRRLPSDERGNLVRQLRRAATSAHSNIAEGHGRGRRGEFVHALRTSRGEVTEQHSQLLQCVRLKYLSADDVSRAVSLCNSASRMITALIHSLSP